MKLSKELILEAVQVIKNDCDIEDYKIMLLAFPIQLEPIKDDIEWKTQLNDIIGSVQLDYGIGTLKLSDDETIEVLSSKKLDPKSEPSLMVIPINQVVMKYKFYPYNEEFAFKEEKPKLPPIIAYERYGNTILQDKKELPKA